MNDYFIKATDKTAMWSALARIGIRKEGDSITVPAGLVFSEIGQIPDMKGPRDANGAPTTMIPGWHANIRGELTAEQQAVLPLIAAPATPYRVWA